MANSINNKIFEIKKKKDILQYGYGILTADPTIVTQHELHCYRKLVWVCYDGFWYITKFSTIEDFESYIKNTPTYSVEQVFELIYHIVN